MADYKITVPLEKAEKDGRWTIRGKAAGLGVDKESQVLRPVAIERLARKINEQPIPFRDWHSKNTILGELGVVTGAAVTPDFELDIEVELDKKHPSSQWLWEKLDEGKQFGMSIGGASNDFKVETEDGKTVLAVYDVEIDEVSVTTKPMWSPSFGTVIKKAIDEEQSKSVEEGQSMDPEESVGTTTADDNIPQPEEAVSTSAPENVAPVTDEPVVIEKAVSADTKRESAKLVKIAKLAADLQAQLAELGITAEPVTDSTEVSSLPVEKSEPEGDDRISQIEARLLEASETLAKQAETIEILKSQIPDTPVPGVLIRKSAVDELMDTFSSLDPRDRLRAGLAALHNETEKLR